MRTTTSRLHGAQGLCLPRKRTRPRDITGLLLISTSHLQIAGCCTSPAIALCMHCHNYKPVSAESRISRNSIVLAPEGSQACAIHNDGSELHGSYALQNTWAARSSTGGFREDHQGVCFELSASYHHATMLLMLQPKRLTIYGRPSTLICVSADTIFSVSQLDVIASRSTSCSLAGAMPLGAGGLLSRFVGKG